MVFRKNLRSLERRWEKISKFLGDLPSEQIFYRNIPLGAPAVSGLEVESHEEPMNHSFKIGRNHESSCLKLGNHE